MGRDHHDPDGRRQRMVNQARQEKAALGALDRAAARLAATKERHHQLLSEAEAAVDAAERAHREALAAYARCASPERAAFHLGLQAKLLRRLVREAAT
jgi:hypothetical protein